MLFILSRFGLALCILSLFGCSSGGGDEASDSSSEPIATYHYGSFNSRGGNDRPYTTVTITLANNLPEDVMRDMSFAIEAHASATPNEGYGFAYFANANDDDCGGYGGCMRSLFDGSKGSIVMRDYYTGISNLDGVSKFQFTEDRLKYNTRSVYNGFSAGNISFSVKAYLKNSSGETISQDYAPASIGYYDSFGVYDDPLRDYEGSDDRADILSVVFTFDPDGGP